MNVSTVLPGTRAGGSYLDPSTGISTNQSSLGMNPDLDGLRRELTVASALSVVTFVFKTLLLLLEHRSFMQQFPRFETCRTEDCHVVYDSRCS
jgi:hypothetical protein